MQDEGKSNRLACQKKLFYFPPALFSQESKRTYCRTDLAERSLFHANDSFTMWDTNQEVIIVAKQGMSRPDVIRGPRNDVSPVPQIQGKAKSGKEKAKPIIAGTSGASQKVWHEKPIYSAHGIIDTDLARDNLENDIPFADLQDL